MRVHSMVGFLVAWKWRMRVGLLGWAIEGSMYISSRHIRFTFKWFDIAALLHLPTHLYSSIPLHLPLSPLLSTASQHTYLITTHHDNRSEKTSYHLFPLLRILPSHQLERYKSWDAHPVPKPK